MMNKRSSSPRRLARRSPELSEITALIDDARRLRLTILALANTPLLSDPARDAVTSLAHVTVKLETIVRRGGSANTKARNRKQRARAPETSPADSTLSTPGDVH
jgi:hypothetical protein